MKPRSYIVYEHLFPNGKRYIGITQQKDPHLRWGKNGICYKNQKKMWNAIQHFGWDKIEHNIIAFGLTEEEAKSIEMSEIAKFDTIHNGYNVSIGGDAIRTTYLSSTLMAYIRACKNEQKVSPIAFDNKENFHSFASTKAEVVIYNMPELCKMSAKNEKEAQFWNEAERAVKIKWGDVSASDIVQVRQFWEHMRNYLMLHIMLCKKEVDT